MAAVVGFPGVAQDNLSLSLVSSNGLEFADLPRIDPPLVRFVAIRRSKHSEVDQHSSLLRFTA